MDLVKPVWARFATFIYFFIAILLTVAYLPSQQSVCVIDSLEFVATCSYSHSCLTVFWLSSIIWADYLAASLCSPASLVMALYAGWSWVDRVRSILRAFSENSCLLWPKWCNGSSESEWKNGGFGPVGRNSAVELQVQARILCWFTAVNFFYIVFMFT